MPPPNVAIADALRGKECRVAKREYDWIFVFGDRLSITVSVPWRIVTDNRISHGDTDDGQWFGLSAPVDGEGRTNELLHGRRVARVEIDEQTADLRIVFADDSRIDVFNSSSGYEGWQVTVPSEGQEITVIALGGGGLTTCSA